MKTTMTITKMQVTKMTRMTMMTEMKMIVIPVRAAAAAGRVSQEEVLVA
jgi:hypothetical protein